jgi:hypothetical protein
LWDEKVPEGGIVLWSAGQDDVKPVLAPHVNAHFVVHERCDFLRARTEHKQAKAEPNS